MHTNEKEKIMRRIIVMASCIGVAALLAVGCATVPKGPTDEEMIAQRIQDGIAAAKAINYDAFDSFVSNSFQSGEVGDKAALLDLLKMGESMGLADDFEIDLSQAKTVVTGDQATVGPITANSSMGSITVTIFGAKENGVWMLTGGEPSY